MSSEFILDVLDRHRERAPVNVEGAIADLGILLQRAPLADEISGMISRISDDLFQITVNSNHSPFRQRFTMAHELAHYIWHRRLIGDGLKDNRLYRADPALGNTRIGSRHERQANAWAARFLMPDHLIERYYAQGIHTAQEMAKKFAVSQRAMEIAMRDNGFVHQ